MSLASLRLHSFKDELNSESFRERIVEAENSGSGESESLKGR